jgi:hypothetical protein
MRWWSRRGGGWNCDVRFEIKNIWAGCLHVIKSCIPPPQICFCEVEPSECECMPCCHVYCSVSGGKWAFGEGEGCLSMPVASGIYCDAFSQQSTYQSHFLTLLDHLLAASLQDCWRQYLKTQVAEGKSRNLRWGARSHGCMAVAELLCTELLTGWLIKASTA